MTLFLASSACFDLRIFLVCDYKFLCTILGLTGPLASHFCAWCLIDKDDSHKLAFIRNKQYPIDLGRLSDGKPGIKNKNLFPFFSLDRVFVDVLHLFLRGMDNLIEKLLKDVFDIWMDSLKEGAKRKKAKFNKSEAEEKAKERVITAFHDCGVKWAFWESDCNQPMISQHLDYPSLQVCLAVFSYALCLLHVTRYCSGT
jgi:hypothetical protein